VLVLVAELHISSSLTVS